MARGHSNVSNFREIKPYPTNPTKISIPISGGASVYKVKPLPPLSLNKEEWEKIGVIAGWVIVDDEPEVE